MAPKPVPTVAQRLRGIWPLLVLLAFGVVTLAAATYATLSTRGGAGSAMASVGGPFTLQSSRGGVLSDAQLKGAPYLVFFGFTHCPDVCPTALTQLSQVLEAAGPQGAGLKALFVTVDPERDTGQVLADYLSSFDPRIIGLTGSEEEIRAMVKAFRAYARKVPQANGDYTMDHSTIVYLMDSQGRFVSSFNLDQTPQKAAAEWLRLR
jgi:protein SCO1